MKIIDVSAGKRAVWFDPNYEDTTFVDMRKEMLPNVVADTCNLPFKSNIFDLAVFDPPHVNFGANAIMSKQYGHTTTAQIRTLITQTSIELARVLKPDGLVAFKWNDHDQKLIKILILLPQFIPLFGHKVSIRTKHSSTTQWVLLRRKDVHT